MQIAKVDNPERLDPLPRAYTYYLSGTAETMRTVRFKGTISVQMMDFGVEI